MDRLLLDLAAFLLMAVLLTAMSYGMAWLFRSKYTPFKVYGPAISMSTVYIGLGLIALCIFCIMPVSCTDAAGARHQAVEQYKLQLESQRHSGQWYYGKVYPERSLNWQRGMWQTPATVNTSSQEFRFSFNWTDNRHSRTTSFSGKRIKHGGDNAAYQGTWFVTNSNAEGEWTLIEVSDDLYCGWLKDKGDDYKHMIFLRRER